MKVLALILIALASGVVAKIRIGRPLESQQAVRPKHCFTVELNRPLKSQYTDVQRLIPVCVHMLCETKALLYCGAQPTIGVSMVQRSV